MLDFSFTSPTKYIFGQDAEHSAGSMAADSGMTSVLVVYGGGSAIRSGLLDIVLKSLQNSGIAYIQLGGVQPNPVDTLVRKGIELCRQNSVNGIVAVGGGSVIDTAKAIAAGVPYNGDFWDFWAGKAQIKQALPVGVVLTIPAAGSEGSGNSVITLTPEMRKISLRTDFALRPKWALMNPKYTFTLPPYQTACGIVDMMAHIYERYFSTTPGVEVTDRVAEGVLQTIIEQGAKVMTTPDNYDVRANIMWSGTLAHNGICGTGRKEDWTSHAMEHEISALHPNVAHGAGLAVIMPAWMTFMAQHAPQKGAQMARRVFGVTNTDDTEAALEGIELLRKFYQSIGMPLTLSELGVNESEIPAMVQRLHENKGAIIGGYYQLTAKETTEIYHLAL
ncbi:MAG: iron-containing alcohol dehydrogenase [Paramuribaculum sp.]|nr:iron-containing alcohol dehydrogenase [Paramuribaculum sp.]